MHSSRWRRGGNSVANGALWLQQPQEGLMGLARYFVLRHADHWLVTLEGRAMAHVATKAQAISSAIVMADLMGAMGHDADVMLDVGEKLNLVWTYGDNALPRARNRSLAKRRSRSPRSHVRPAQVAI
jgi:hypothetical protein